MDPYRHHLERCRLRSEATRNHPSIAGNAAKPAFYSVGLALALIRTMIRSRS